MSLRFLTAGDSHGDSLLGIIEGLPAGIPVSVPEIRRNLRRRSQSYGRSSRQRIETDKVEILSGLWRRKTTGAPVAIRIPNLARRVGGGRGGGLSTAPRPGHADLAGLLKYGLSEIPPVSERASARETAMRVAIGTIAKGALKRFSVDVVSHVRSIGHVLCRTDTSSVEHLRRRVARSPVYCGSAAATRDMLRAIDVAREAGHSLGGSAEVIVSGVPPGLGSHAASDRNLDARLAAALMSIQSVKAVEIGEGLETSRRYGIDAQDPIVLEDGAIRRSSNLAGGIEGGISNGENIIARVYAKPIPTARRRAATVDMSTLETRQSPYVRSDVCVVPALAVITEAVAAWEILGAHLEKFGGDHVEETERNLKAYRTDIERRSRR